MGHHHDNSVTKRWLPRCSEDRRLGGRSTAPAHQQSPSSDKTLKHRDDLLPTTNDHHILITPMKYTSAVGINQRPLSSLTFAFGSQQKPGRLQTVRSYSLQALLQSFHREFTPGSQRCPKMIQCKDPSYAPTCQTCKQRHTLSDPKIGKEWMSEYDGSGCKT